MNKSNILLNLLVSIKTNYSNNNKFAYCKSNKFCLNLLYILYKDGLINSYKLDSVSNKVKIELKYVKNKPIIKDLNLISKPSLVIYSGFDNLKRLNSKYDYFILTTSEGILSSQRFFKSNKTGGQLLFGLKFNTF